MNPMNKPPVIVDLILQHLTGNEMLADSLVSQSWYSSIGQSLQFRKKVEANIDEDTYQFGPFGVASHSSYWQTLIYERPIKQVIKDFIDRH